MTELIRRTPFDEVFKLNTAMEQLFNNAVVPTLRTGHSASLPLDVFETADSYVVHAAVPGINPDALDIEINDQTLTVRGEWKQPEQPQGVTYHVMERPTGRFERTLQFPLPLNADAAQANYENGILSFTLPKSEAAKPRKIKLTGQQRQIEAKAT